MDMNHWHGAQWVLATWWLVMTFAPMITRVATLDELKEPKPWRKWWGEEIARWASRWTMIFVLNWGGFWS